MQFTEVRRSVLSKVVVADAGTATSSRPSFFHPRGLLPVLIATSLLVFTAVRADTVADATEVIKAQLSPILDSLAQASASMAIEDRATASMQLGLTISLANGLSSTIQAPEMVATLGKKAKSFQKGVTRFQDRLTKAKTLLDKPMVANATASKATKATKAMIRAVSEGQRLRRQMFAVPAGPADTIAPSVPGGVTAYASSPWQSVIYWNASTDAGGSSLTGYKVYRDGTLVATIATTSYTDSGLSAGTQYCYTIVAYDKAGNTSSASAQACVTTQTPASTAPVPPSNLATMVVTPTYITLNWQDNSDNETGFQVERASGASGPWSVVGTTGMAATAFTDTGLAPSTTYYYRVLAFN